MEHHKVVIIGGGPAGLATALELNRLGVKDVVVLERELQAGGIPRHCGHKGFALYKNYGLLTGPKLAAHLRDQAKPLDVRTGTTVLEFNMRGNMRVQTTAGVVEMSADKIVLATGARETSRAAHLVGGNKCQGIMNVGELQQRVYLNGERPFKRPVVIGSEWISYSALMTCRHLQVKPVIMATQGAYIDAPRFFALGSRLIFGVKLLTHAKLMAVNGKTQVEAVEFDVNGSRKIIECDGVILSGKLRPEDALLRPNIPNLFTVGNVRGNLLTAGACMAEGRNMAKVIAA